MTQILVPLLIWICGELALRHVPRANCDDTPKLKMYAEESFGRASIRASAVLTPWFFRIGIMVFIVITSIDKAQGATLPLIVFGGFLVSFIIARYFLQRKFEAEEGK